MLIEPKYMFRRFALAMTRRFCGGLSRFARDPSGSFTLEAALLFPLLLLIVMALLSFSLMLYNRSELYASTAVSVDRAAFNWDNSAKDPITGAYPLGQNDGLYWRTGSDSLSDAFSFLVKNEGTEVELPVPSVRPTAFSLPQVKLSKAGELLSNGISGSLNYTNKLYSKTVQARVDRKPTFYSFGAGWFAPSPKIALHSSVTDSVELLRMVDLVRTFSLRLKALFSRDSTAVITAQIPQPTPIALKLTSEKEAAEWLRSLLGSESAVYVTTPSGKQRKLDTLDPDGLFHEAKFGYTSKTESVESQIAKDLELLGSGSQVKGIVWHFFRDSRNGKLGPSKPLRKELEKRGIVIVIHS